MTIRVAIIGAGIMGAAAAYALARRGANVTVFEQFPVSHERGSSHGATRLFRTAYFEHPDYVPLTKRAAAGWRALETSSGKHLLDLCGVFMAGRPDTTVMSGTKRAAEQHNLPLQNITHAHVTKRMPWFQLDRDMELLIEPDAGIIYADRARAAFLHGAKAHGAILHENCQVGMWTPTDGQIEVTASEQHHCFDRLIVTPGAFAAALPGLSKKYIQPVRKALFWTSPGDPLLTLANGFLPFAIEEADGRFRYGLPAIDRDGVKIGEHTGGAAVADPGDGTPDQVAVARIDMEAYLKRRIPGFSPTITKEQACLYAMSPDGHFIIDQHPDDARIITAMGFSGHGFKFAPVIGEALADLALTGETLREFDFLKQSRFDQA